MQLSTTNLIDSHLFRIGGAAVGHAIASAVVVSAVVGFSVVAYFGMLAWAVLVGEPIGGALALPFMMLASLFGSMVAVVSVLLPSTLAGQVLRRTSSWPKLTEIPLATVSCAAIVLAIGVVVGALNGAASQGLQLAVVIGVILLAPLGLYWWSLQASTWLIELGCRSWRWLRPTELVTGNSGGAHSG